MQYSDFERPNESTRSGGTPATTSDDLAAQISAALDQDDYLAAGGLLREGLERFPESNRLLRLAARQRKLEERFTHVRSLLKETREALADDAFVRAIGAFREAVNLSQGFAGLEEAAFGLAMDEARGLGDRNWRIARSLLEDASLLNPKLVIPGHLWQGVQAAECEETIANVLAETALAKPDDLERARDRLTRTLEQYQDDSGLLNRLKSIKSTIEEKRRWDERQKHLKKLTDLRDSLQREENPAEAGKYVRLSETLAVPYSAEPEFGGLIEDIRQQVISSEKAEAALKQDRIDDCLEECAWVLSRMRHHQLFLKLKEKAEKRELALVDEYSEAVSRIKQLLGAGELEEAATFCSAARAKLPQFADLAELSKEIAQRKTEQDQHVQENGDSARRLVERGDRNLRARQFRATEQSFGNALKLLPGDKNLAGVVLGILHGYARSTARANPESAEEALRMAERLLPGSPVPADLTEGLRQNREHARQESIRWLALNRIGVLDAQVGLAKKREQLIALRDEAKKNDFASASHADVRGAVAALFTKIDAKLEAANRKQERELAIFRATSIAAAIIFAVGLVYWLNNRAASPRPAKAETIKTLTFTRTVPAAPAATGSLLIRSEVAGAQVFINGKEYTVSSQPLKLELNAAVYRVSGSRPGYQDFGPVTVAVAKSSQTVLEVKLLPKPASLEIVGAEADTEIKLDGVSLGKFAPKEVFAKEVAPGAHSIEVLRRGYLAKTITRSLAPGGALVLSGRDMRLESLDASTLASPKPSGNRPRSTPSFAAIEGFDAKYPARSPAETVQPNIGEFQWQSVDKSNPDSLREFVAKYPASPFVTQAKREMESVLLAREAKAEEGDWRNSDPGNKAALEDFLKKYPSGRNAPAAANALAELERKTRAAETLSLEEGAWKKVNRRDEAALESYLRDSPAGRYRSQAEAALASLRLNQSSKNDSVAVLTVLSRFASAWSTKDLDSILAIQGSLNKHAVKAELSQIKELNMRISPASPPQIAGSQAVVLCRRQASQVFSDGTRKQIPESIVSYVLEKHGGNWTIEGMR
jgi:hypothetical protein